ncbi:MAG: hypothetical protein IK012_10760 [Fibrobacter sp.]|uniref:hypothetical protein n=1 Tax=Fibrobacter sp. TaxID=35828 RepID=UPI0025BF5E1B|nr:hypothetical protein [Fibrobacter sp.]MBR4785712.1 hypothetical protein [Fibrobacter sp.]
MTWMMKKFCFFAMALPMVFFAACTTDGPTQIIMSNGDIYSEEEYNDLVKKGEIDENGNYVVKESEAKSSSSSNVSSSSAKSSSSSEKVSSSSEKKSSSSDKVESSSSEEKSSSSEKVESSSSAPESSAVAGKETIVDEDEGEFSIGTDDMEELPENEQSELDSLKELLDNGETVDGFEKTDSSFDEESLLYEDFDENDFFCFTDEGQWLQITREKLGEYIPHYKNGQAWGNFRQFDVKFMDACESVYIKRK